MIDPGGHSPHPRERPVDVHAGGDDVRRAVSVEIPGRQRDQVRGRTGNGVLRELHPAVVFEPDEAGRGGVVPVVVGAGDDDIEIAVAVDIRRLGARGAGQVGDAVKVELQLPLVLEPLHAVPRPAVRRGVVERVAVAVHEIDVAVVVQVCQRQPARSEIRIGRAPDHPRREASRPVVHESPDLLPLLADQRHDVGTAIVVDVGNGRVDRS